MKKVIAIVMLLALIGGGVWAYLRFLYVPPVDKAFLRTVAAATLGDEQVFLDGFTARSRPLVAGLLGLARGKDPRHTRSHPYYFLVTEEIEAIEVEPGGEVAWLTLRRPGDRGRRSSYDVRLLVEEGNWRIDALSFTGKRRTIDRAR
ncbi:MAG: hypothetical protein RIT45_3610 [Pseudomonadota bacterium]